MCSAVRSPKSKSNHTVKMAKMPYCLGLYNVIEAFTAPGTAIAARSKTSDSICELSKLSLPLSHVRSAPGSWF
jgi:hypothetical protein